jgi:hypothetical protein
MSEPVSMGIIFNFSTRSVQGFGLPGLGDYPGTITGLDVKIVFGGRQGGQQTPSYVTSHNIIGALDRVTGYLEATSSYDENGKTLTVTAYALQCRPAQRMF